MKKNQGFTLIELLVVIAIIGLLSSIVLASLNSARVKSRDATRQADVEQIRNAIELYESDHNGSYPDSSACTNSLGVNNYWCCLGVGTGGTCWAGVVPGNDTLNAALQPYLPTIPLDPLHNTATYGDAFLYRLFTDSNGTYVKIDWGMEKPTPTTSSDCLGGAPGQWSASSGLGNGVGDYCVLSIH